MLQCCPFPAGACWRWLIERQDTCRLRISPASCRVVMVSDLRLWRCTLPAQCPTPGWGDWKRGTGKVRTGKRGTKSQGWKLEKTGLENEGTSCAWVDTDHLPVSAVASTTASRWHCTRVSVGHLGYYDTTVEILMWRDSGSTSRPSALPHCLFEITRQGPTIQWRAFMPLYGEESVSHPNLFAFLGHLQRTTVDSQHWRRQGRQGAQAPPSGRARIFLLK